MQFETEGICRHAFNSCLPPRNDVLQHNLMLLIFSSTSQRSSPDARIKGNVAHEKMSKSVKIEAIFGHQTHRRD
ncbi:hypothetical protein CEXT_684741 [Caerostris extrusa]|uniref:Uncharacterized protein n=1 Tax=Caerostris extrusa TaxID=172846 RepID=A0AAV4Y177_CAEEX|nr:hypothetical protein CEXT_684741 [Caerostris extrusa]